MYVCTVNGIVMKLREATSAQFGKEDKRMAVLKIPFDQSLSLSSSSSVSLPLSLSLLVIVISKHVEPNNMSVFEKLEIDPMQFKAIVLKSRVHWQNSYVVVNHLSLVIVDITIIVIIIVIVITTAIPILMIAIIIIIIIIIIAINSNGFGPLAKDNIVIECDGKVCVSSSISLLLLSLLPSSF